MTTLKTQVLGGIIVPSTPLISAALAFARDNSNDVTYNHVVRSWLFGHYIAEATPSIKDRDVEAQSIAAILHDLGWSSNNPSLISTDKRFEVDGANAARNFILREGVKEEWDAHRLQLVWDAIALHTTTSIAMFKEKEVVACCAGITAEFVPLEASFGAVLTKEVWDGIVKEFPRDGFSKGVKEVLCGLCRTKEATTWDNFVGDFGERFVAGYKREGRLVDFIDLIQD